MIGMIYTLMNVTLRNQRFLWIQVVLYVACIAVYFFLKSELNHGQPIQ